MSLERVLPAARLERPADAPFGGNGSRARRGPGARADHGHRDLGASACAAGRAGFPTATKWLSALQGRSDDLPTTVVVNTAEGEPGSYKDRSLLQRNPYSVLEGALIAPSSSARIAWWSARRVVRRSARSSTAIAEVREAGWADDVSLEVNAGPEEYLVGEETGLLEVIDGRPPFPRVAPLYRRGAPRTSRPTRSTRSNRRRRS